MVEDRNIWVDKAGRKRIVMMWQHSRRVSDYGITIRRWPRDGVFIVLIDFGQRTLKFDLGKKVPNV